MPSACKQQVKAGLVPLLEEVRSAEGGPSDALLRGDFDTTQQAELVSNISVALGFNLTNGRIDQSIHPFAIGAACIRAASRPAFLLAML